MNLCIFVGNFVDDPEYNSWVNEKTGKEVRVVNFKLAINRPYKNKGDNNSNDVDFFHFEAWDTGADLIQKWFHKGDQILVNCTARNHRWEDNEGNKRSRDRFRVDRFEFLNGRKRRDDDDKVENNTDNEGDNEGDEEVPF